jgi:hypothetical protein
MRKMDELWLTRWIKGTLCKKSYLVNVDDPTVTAVGIVVRLPFIRKELRKCKEPTGNQSVHGLRQQTTL